ncbi:MAG TPA: response regulator [Leptolyngbyaceae cyanobacterium]
MVVLDSGDIKWVFDRFQCRRYRRYLKSYSASLESALGALRDTVSSSSSELDAFAKKALRDYDLLSSWVNLGKIELDAYCEFINASVSDVLFDVVWAGDIKHELHKQSFSLAEASPYRLDVDVAVSQMKGLWQSWSNAALEKYHPELAPVIKQPDAMQAAVSHQAYQGLVSLLDGRHSLRDLAAKTRRPIVQFTQALKPYLDAGWLNLVSVLEGEAAPAKLESNGLTPTEANPLIACIDDSLMICQSMGQVVKAAGYDFISIMEASGAIKTLLMRRPSLIFLDLVMPDTNGYEICSQLRKITLFKETPIIILSGNDGLVDQVRARLLGATDFLSKPMEPVVILNIIQKHLGQVAPV